VRAALLAVLSEVEHPRPRIILDDAGVPQQFTLIPLAHLSGRPQEEFASVHEAVRFFLGRSRAGVRFREKLSVLEGKLRQGVDRAHRTLEAVRADLERHDRAEEYERAGHLLMANITQLRKGAHEAVLADLDDPSAVVSVALDPALTPMENAQKYFDRARRSRQSHDETVARAGQLAGRVGRGTALLDLLHAVHTPEALAAFVEQHGPEMEEFNIGEKAEARQQIPFRIFMVDGGFEVWAGKSSTNNDELTLRHARPEDLWFHARGSSGSHVILKIASGKGEPSKKAREQAAAVAAYYSKMKTAGLVPVAMTEKKYVRKPKGAPPGTVTIEREKVLFVRPALPGPEKGSPLEP
jgi:predicted ribosome quality control (RQC) complex YloA/Tae2 family protein